MFTSNPSRNMPHGFTLTFANGYSVSVQWSEGTYCAGRGKRSSPNAEIAILAPDGEFAPLEAWGDDVQGYQTPDEVLAVLNIVAAYPKPSQYPLARCMVCGKEMGIVYSPSSGDPGLTCDQHTPYPDYD